MNVKKLFITPLLLAVILVGCSETLTEAETDSALNAPSSTFENTAVFEVAVRNVTTGQPLTPPLAATHNANVDMFSVGENASFGIKEIAENGNLDPLHQSLTGNANVADVVVAVAGDPPPVLPGQTVKFNITTSGDKKYLSFASMLICTNDGFTGLDAVRLPGFGEEKMVGINAYDAGTEINTEDFADIVPPCQALVGVTSEDDGTGESNPELAEGGVIQSHPGIQGGDDLLPGVHGWNNPVGKVAIRRVR